MKSPYRSNNFVNKWSKLSICEQLGNVGSEVGRAVKFLNKGDRKLTKDCLKRAFELLNLTIADPRWQNYRQKELKIAREVLADTFYGARAYGDTPEKLEKYFFEYAMAAQKNR